MIFNERPEVMPDPSEYNHPYKVFEKSPLWKVVDKAIAELIQNKDLQENTNHDPVVRYIVKCLSEKIDLFTAES